MGSMKKITIFLFSLCFFSSAIYANQPWREGKWSLGDASQENIYFIEMDGFDQQFLTVSVAPQLANGEPGAAVKLHCTRGDFIIQPGEKATCVVNWSYEIATLTLPKDKSGVKSAGTYKITYLS